MSVDVGLGVVGEKRRQVDVISWFCTTATERLAHKLTSTSTIAQSFTGVWKARDFGNSLYTVGAAITSAVSTRTEIKLEVLDTFRNATPSPSVKKNDVALIGAFVFKL